MGIKLFAERYWTNAQRLRISFVSFNVIQIVWQLSEHLLNSRVPCSVRKMQSWSSVLLDKLFNTFDHEPIGNFVKNMQQFPVYIQCCSKKCSIRLTRAVKVAKILNRIKAVARNFLGRWRTYILPTNMDVVPMLVDEYICLLEKASWIFSGMCSPCIPLYCMVLIRKCVYLLRSRTGVCSQLSENIATEN